MKVVCACMCACLAVTVAGKWTEEPEGTLNIDKERQDMTTLFPDNTNEITDSPDVTTNTIEIFTDFATDTSGSNSEITTPADNTPSEDTTTNSPTPITTTPITTTPTTTTTSSTATITTSHSTTPSYPMDWYTRPVDCADLLMAGATASGVYVIYPFTCMCSKPVKVWCDMETDGGGWTVFLKRERQTKQLDFNRTYEEYKAGFGSPDKEYWLGLEMLHVMTHGRVYSLRLDLNSSNLNGYAPSDSIKVMGEDRYYQVLVSGYRGKKGNPLIGNCFRYMSYNSYFSTFDHFQRAAQPKCAAIQGGGWWYYTNCKYFNPTSTYGTAINLTCYNSPPINVTRLQLKIRPAICEATHRAIDQQGIKCGC